MQACHFSLTHRRVERAIPDDHTSGAGQKNGRVLPAGYLIHEAAAPQKTASFAIFIGTPPRVVTN